MKVVKAVSAFLHSLLWGGISLSFQREGLAVGVNKGATLPRAHEQIPLH